MYTCIVMLFETNRMIVFGEKEKEEKKGDRKKTEDETKRRKCILKNS